MQIDVVKILYLFFRLSPFVLVSYFILTSIFNQDIKGLIYLMGLLLTCAFAVAGASALELSMGVVMEDDSDNKNLQCTFTYLGITQDGGNEALSKKVPLGTLTLVYTLFYCLYVIIEYNLAYSNIPFLILLPLLIVSDITWQLMNGCVAINGIVFAIIFGIFGGFMYALVIDTLQISELQTFNGLTSAEVCSRPTRSQYRCRIKKKDSAKQ